jgi:DNA primase
MGNVIAFGARVINPEDQPKYLNSADHKGYDKSKTLYGLDKAKHTIKEFQSLIIVE